MSGSVALVGLGAMGAPIGTRLLAASLPLRVWDRDRAKADPLVALGATVVDRPADAARSTEGGVVLVVVSDAKAVRAVTFGRRGIASGAVAGTLVVNLSTIAPAESRTIAERLAPRGVHYLEAPLGGSRDSAERGELIAFVGGRAEDLERARPLLASFCQRIEPMGAIGQGSAMKLVNNLVTIATVGLDAEAIALAEALGLDRGRAIELMLAGGGASRMLTRKQDAFLRREYPAQFRLVLADKDLGLIRSASRSVGGTTPMAREMRRLVAEALRAGDADQDFAVVFEAARRRLGLPPRPAAGGSAPDPSTPGPPPG